MVQQKLRVLMLCKGKAMGLSGDCSQSSCLARQCPGLTAETLCHRVTEAGSICSVTGKHQKLQGDRSTKPRKSREGVFTTVSQPGGMRGTISAWEERVPM